jgi:UDP-N-acetylmuramate dehydrogenase
MSHSALALQGAGFNLLDGASLEGRNTFRVAARANLLADVDRAEGIAELMAVPGIAGLPLLVLGEGSNILFAGDAPGLVLSVSGHGIEELEDLGDALRLRVQAGLPWNDLVRWSLGRGYMGLENLSLIPGSVGASPIQNIGAYGAEVAEFIETVEAWDREAGGIRRLSASDCGFGYRDSLFKRQPGRWIVTAVEFLLPRRRELRLDYAGVPEELAAMRIEKPRAVHVAEAICRIRSRKLPDPAVLGNAGSFFKNPVLSAAAAEDLAARHPGLPVFPAGNPELRKVSAAWLIEQAGWKGRREGDAGVSSQHALVLVNHGRASGAQILALALRIAQDVFERFGVALEPEPLIVGATWQPPR